MSEESLLSQLAELRGAVVAYREMVNTVLAGETSLVSILPKKYQRDATLALSDLQHVQNRLDQQVRIADRILRPRPAPGRTPVTNVLPDGEWHTVATLRIVETYEIELALEPYAAGDQAEAEDRLDWLAKGMTPEQVREEYRQPNPNNQRLSTYVEVQSLGSVEFEAAEDVG